MENSYAQPPGEKESFIRRTLRRVSRSRSSSKKDGKKDYVKTNITLATEKQAREDDEINRRIYDQKRQLYQQIDAMIDNSDVLIDFRLTNQPSPPPTPDNHSRWLKHQQAMTPQPAWMIVQATKYLINKGYRPGHDCEVDKTIDFCRQVASQNNEMDVLEYKDINESPLPMSPDSITSPLPAYASTTQSLYNFGISFEGNEKAVMECKPVHTYRYSENLGVSPSSEKIMQYEGIASAPPLPTSVTT